MAQLPTEYLDYRLFLFHQTQKAILVGETLSKAKAFWLPLSQISYEEVGTQGKLVDVSIPEWLCIEKGLV